MSENHDTFAAVLKMAWTWLAVGVSVMTPLQVVQLIAAAAATIYSLVQTFFLLRDRLKRRRARK